MRLLADAKQKALLMSDNYLPLTAAVRQLPGKAMVAGLSAEIEGRIESGVMTAHDGVIARQMSLVLSGGDGEPGAVSEQQLLDLELEVFLRLLAEPASQARMEHMLKTGKPLRN